MNHTGYKQNDVIQWWHHKYFKRLENMLEQNSYYDYCLPLRNGHHKKQLNLNILLNPY